MSASAAPSSVPVPMPPAAASPTPSASQGSATWNGASGSASPAPVDLGAMVSDPNVLARLIILLVAFAAYFRFWFYQQTRIAIDNGADWGHTVIVPLVCLYLFWQHRREFMACTLAVFWPGVLALVLGVLSYVFFVVGVPNHLGQGLSMVLSMFGLIALLLGPRALRYVFLPAAYMVFAITLPEQWMIKLTFPLQIIASEGSFAMLEVAGVDLTLKGNVLEVMGSDGKPVPLNVAEQCSGMRTLVSFIALGGAVCLVATGAWWKRIILMASALPVAVFLNILRVALLAYFAQWNPELSRGEAHTLIGMLLLIPGFFAYLGLVWVLNKAVAEEPERPLPPLPLLKTQTRERGPQGVPA